MEPCVFKFFATNTVSLYLLIDKHTKLLESREYLIFSTNFEHVLLLHAPLQTHYLLDVSL